LEELLLPPPHPVSSNTAPMMKHDGMVFILSLFYVFSLFYII